MTRAPLALMVCALAVLGLAGLLIGEVALAPSDLVAAIVHPASPAGEILWRLRAPRTVLAALVGAALGLAGAAMQGLLRNPLAEPGVLGVSAGGGLGAALAVVAGASAAPGLVNLGALAGALLSGVIVAVVAARVRSPAIIILFGVSLSAFAGALTSLAFNLSPSPMATSELLFWLYGSVSNRDWGDVGRLVIPAGAGAALCFAAAPGLAQLTLGDEAADASGLPMRRLRVFAVAGAALLTGASVAAAGVIGFVGLVAPHLVRQSVRDDPAAVLVPSAAAGAVIVVAADLVCRIVPTDAELRLGVLTGLLGAPVFAILAARAGRSWSQ